MKTKLLLIMLCVTLMTGSVASAALVVDTTTPAADVINSQTNAPGLTRIFSLPDGTGGNDNHGRGGAFTTPDNLGGQQWSMTSVTLVKNATQTFTNGTVSLWVFEGTAAQWDAGDGDSDGDLFDGTGITNIPVNGETFTINGTVADESFLHFNLASAVLLDENTSYGFIFLYEDNEGPDYLEVHEALGTAGTQLRILTGDNTIATNRPLTYYVQATPITNFARLIAPALGSEVAFDTGTSLEWGDPTAYTPSATALYLRAGDPNFHLAGNIIDGVAATSPTATGALDPTTTYYWRVDTTDPNDGGTPVPYTGTTWDFYTSTPAPTILINEADLAAAVGETVTFTTTSMYVNGWQWYKDGGAMSGENDPDLVITVSGSSDEAVYTCVGTGTYGGSATTDFGVVLMTKRLIAEYTFDDLTNTADKTSVFEADDLTLGSAGAYDADGLQVYGDPNAFAMAGTWDPTPYDNSSGFTIIAWIKTATPASGNLQGIFCKNSAPDATSNGWGVMEVIQGGTFRTGSGTTFDPTTLSVDPNELTMVAWTWEVDEETGGSERYLNGLIPNHDNNGPREGEVADGIVIGARGAGSWNYGDEPAPMPFTGVIDDIQVYNYTMSGEEIADLTGIAICLADEPPSYDLNDDCKVNLGDLALLATEWLDSGLYTPTP